MANSQDSKTGQDWPSPPVTVVDANRLVGNFMYHWANLEAGLDVAIRRILRIDNLAMAILSVNLTAAAKLYTARCAVGLFGEQEEKWQKAAQKVLIDIGKMSEVRNMVAHTAFGVSSDKTAVEFYRIKATSKLSVPDEKWAPSDFSTKAMMMSALVGELKSVMDGTVELRAGIDLRNRDTQSSISRLLQLGQEALANEERPSTMVNALFPPKRKAAAAPKAKPDDEAKG